MEWASPSVSILPKLRKYSYKTRYIYRGFYVLYTDSLSLLPIKLGFDMASIFNPVYSISPFYMARPTKTKGFVMCSKTLTIC